MRIVLTLLLALTLAACGTTKKDLTSPLAFVPADTPYVFANLESMPASVTQAYADMLRPTNEALSRVLAEVRADLEQSGKDEDEKRKMLGLMDLLSDKLTVEGWEAIGFTREGRGALYGVGVMPVGRIELADPEKLRGFVRELEALAGKPLPTAEIEGHTYWRLQPDEAKDFAVVIAIIGNHLVMTLDAGADVVPLAELLGLRQPERSLLDSGELAQLNREFGYTPYGTVLVDSRRLVTALFGSEGRDTWMTRKMAEQGEALEPACRSELMGLAETMPRLVGGYTRMDGHAIDSHGLLELKPAIAQAFQGMVAPVPGVGNHDGKVPLDIGWGLKLDKLAEFLQAQANAVNAAPYTCQMLAGLNTAASQIGQQTAGLYMVAGWFTGLRVVLERLEWEDGMTPRQDSIEGALVLASPNPVGLINMLKGFVPQLAELNLTPGAAPQLVPLQEMGAGDAPPAWAALSDAAIGLGTGANAASRLPGYLTAAVPSRVPLMHFSYQGAFYGELMRKMQEATDSAMTSAMDAVGDMDEGASNDEDKARKLERQREREQSRRTQRYMQEFMAAIYTMYDAIEFTSGSVIPSERGLEMDQILRLRR